MGWSKNIVCTKENKILIYIPANPRWFFSGGRGDWVRDWGVATVLSSDRQALFTAVLFDCRPAEHRSYVPVLTHVVHQPVCHLYSRQVGRFFHPLLLSNAVSYSWGDSDIIHMAIVTAAMLEVLRLVVTASDVNSRHFSW